jgi:hypothetical protein
MNTAITIETSSKRCSYCGRWRWNEDVYDGGCSKCLNRELEKEREHNSKLNRQVNALRGVITRMKKAK